MGKRRTAARESAREAMLAQQQTQASHSHASPQAPQSAEAPHPSTELTHSGTAHQSPDAVEPPLRPCSEKRSNSADEQEEPTFNEMTSRRNLRVSRSGRFKEKKRIRVSLPPDEEEDADKPSAKDKN